MNNASWNTKETENVAKSITNGKFTINLSNSKVYQRLYFMPWYY